MMQSEMSSAPERFEKLIAAALERLDPATATARVLASQNVTVEQHAVLAIGKCAGLMMDGAHAVGRPAAALTVTPSGYPGSQHGLVIEGEHPVPGEGSFRAGAEVISFVRDSGLPVLLLISGGASSCAEVPLPGLDPRDLIEVWERMLAAALPITLMNSVRIRLSAVKGGRLGRLMPSGSRVLIHSDVPAGSERFVGSSPAFGVTHDEEILRVLAAMKGDAAARALEVARRSDEPPVSIDHSWHLTASSALLVEEIASIARSDGWSVQTPFAPDAMDGPAAVIARRLVEHLRGVPPGTLLVAGGETLVDVRKPGRGGRCTDLAARLALETIGEGLRLWGRVHATDGVDGSSGLSSVVIDPRVWPEESELRGILNDALARSSTASVANRLGRAVMMRAGGNNLRDVALLARG